MTEFDLPINGRPAPEPEPRVPVSPLPVAWWFDPIMVGDMKAYRLRTEDPSGTNYVFLDEQHAALLRDRITECITGLVLP